MPDALQLLEWLERSNALLSGCEQRDKFFKAAQYGARVLHLVLLPAGSALTRRLEALDKGVAQPRKLLRFGKAGGELATLLRPTTPVRKINTMLLQRGRPNLTLTIS